MPIQQIEAKSKVGGGGILSALVSIVAVTVVALVCQACAPIITQLATPLAGAMGGGFLATVAATAMVATVMTVATGAILCAAGSGSSSLTAPFSGCRGGGGGGGGGDTQPGPSVLSQQVVNDSQTPGAQLSCMDPAYPQLCGVSSCIPANAICCSSVGYADRYCPANSFCTTGGQCEATTGGQNCNANYNSACTSSANSCGMTNSGFHSCTGTCQAVTPADNTCPTPGITLTQTPAFVNVGDTCAVTWSTTNTTACSLVNLTTNTTVASGKNGNYVTPPLNVQNDFRLNCSNGSVVASHANISCRINPSFQEN